MGEVWKEFEGEVVDGKLLLQEYLGGDDNQGVFLTALGDPEPRKAAIKLLREDPHGSKRRQQHWKFAEKVSHPHLMRVFGSGSVELRGEAMLYVVMEYAEENLGQVIPHRALTGPEAGEMLEPALQALAYLHGEGFVHGHLKPSNILAVDGTLRISSDRLCRTGDQDADKPDAYAPPEMDLEGFSPPGDVWSLGMTLTEALTQKRPAWEGTAPEEPSLPDTIPAPFLEIARNCLCRNPRSRWRVTDIEKRLRQAAPAIVETKVEEEQRAPRRLIFAVSAVLAVILALVLFGPRVLNRVESSGGGAAAAEPPVVLPKAEEKVARKSEPVRTEPVAPAPVEEKAPPATPPHSTTPALPTPPVVATAPPATPPVIPAPVEAKPKDSSPASSGSSSSSEGIQKVMPETTAKARNSIQGRVRVTVRVQVDASGKVTDAELESPGPSRYFADAALEAAHRWKFPPADGARTWDLPFVIQRNGTSVAPVLVGR
ncbi:MAG TPA: TonB family protein [Bryobacteraceae bacterium]|nr:TonB family protein [Bryobacteraceae bacterium]